MGYRVVYFYSCCLIDDLIDGHARAGNRASEILGGCGILEISKIPCGVN